MVHTLASLFTDSSPANAMIAFINNNSIRTVGDLSVNDVEKSHKNLRKAVEDAALTYKKYMAGEEIAQPPSNFQKAGNVVTNLFNRFLNNPLFIYAKHYDCPCMESSRLSANCDLALPS